MHLWNSNKNEIAATGHDTLTFYTDGSLRKINPGPNQQILMGAAWYNVETECKFKHKVTGMASSTNPEGIAILSALEASPPNHTIEIHTDSQSALQRLQLITEGAYKHIPISHILKIPNWQTWEAINNLISQKNLTVHTFKVEAHTGNPFNDTADTLAKEGCRLQKPAYVHNNLTGSRIAFALANRGSIIEKNPRKFLKHMSQNIHRGEWSTHHTSNRTKSIAKRHPIDWQMYKEIFNTDGKQKAGFSSRKTCDLRTYIAKVYTDTLPTMDILHSKWNIYLNNICPRCTTHTETNNHLWQCTYSMQALQDITDEFKTKFNLPQSTDDHINAAIRAMPTVELTTLLRNHFVNTANADNLPVDTRFENTTQNKINKAFLSIIIEGKQRIWKPRNDAALAMQQVWDVSKKAKRPRSNKISRPCIKKNKIISDLANNIQDPIVLIDNTKLNQTTDPYRCRCGLHSLIHSPGRQCNKAGVTLQRAKELALSADRRQLDLIPLIFSPILV
jgi:ribonuclease HI